MKKILSLVLGLLWALPVWGANCNLFDMSQSPTRERIDSDLIWTRYNINVSSVGLSVGNWTAKHTDFISPGTYTITINGVDSIAVRGYDGSNLSILRRGNGSFTITNPSQIWIFGATPETIAQITEIMLEQGSTATSYQPYNATCDDRCKNLFDKAQTPYSSGVYISSATVGQTGFELSSNSNYNVYRVEIQPSTTYTFGLIKATSPKWVVTDANNVVLDTGTNNGGEAGNSITITTGATAKYLYLSVSVNEKYKCIDILQLELGDTATEYVPYNAACHNNKITIATTKYNESAFSPLNTALQNAISVVDSVVSNTITQAGRIATLQAQKQTRPNDIADDNEKCPAGKKCLLVEDANGVPHWYEIVENASLLPDGYTQLQYIESTGEQYIDTNYTWTSANHKVVAKISDVASGNNQWLWGSYTNNSNIRPGTIAITSADKLSVGVGNVGTASNTYTIDVPTTPTTLTLEVKDDNTFSLLGGSTNYTDVSVSGTFITRIPEYIFAGNQQGAASYSSQYKLYSLQMYDNNTLVRDFIPAKDSSGKIGMYDTVSGTFFTNQGTGEFVAGDPVVE